MLPVTTTETCDGSTTVGGLPAAECPPTEPVAYDFTLKAGYLDPGGGIGLLLAAPWDSISPEPDGLQAMTDAAIPLGTITGAPTNDQIPGSWQNMSPGWIEVSSGFPAGLLVPAAYVPPQLVGNPIWLRVKLRDSTGCVTTAVAYFPEGIPDPDTWPVEATVYVRVLGSEDRPWETMTLPATEGVEDADSREYFGVQGVCPDPGLVVAVGPGCGRSAFVVEGLEGGVPVPVAGELTATVDLGVEPVRCDPEDEGSPLVLPVKVCPPAAPVVLPSAVANASAQQDGGDPSDVTDTLAAGAVSVVIEAHCSDLKDGSTARFKIDGWPEQNVPINGAPVVLPALGAGMLYPAIELLGHAESTQAEAVFFTAVGLLPPA